MDLNDDLIIHVASFLDVISLSKMICVRQFNGLKHIDFLWRYSEDMFMNFLIRYKMRIVLNNMIYNSASITIYALDNLVYYHNNAKERWSNAKDRINTTLMKSVRVRTITNRIE